jgi:pSer/pThr/pTyr-binding forkhead associated (FHA) protein
MAKLILSVDGQVLKEFTLSKERTLIGRKPHNDIQIDNLAVSGEHAAIITILNDSFIEDLGSTNGTMVNGKPIKKHFLQNNDVVELGKHKLKYFNDAPTAATAADFEKTMIIRNPAKAAPPPPKAEELGDTHTNLKPLAQEIPKSAEPTRPTQESKPAPKQPEAKAPEKAPEQKAPEQKAPEQKAPEQKAPEQKAPEFKMPEFRPPDFKAPEPKPEQKMPEQKAAPEQKAPDKKAPETSPPPIPAGPPAGAPPTPAAPTGAARATPPQPAGAAGPLREAAVQVLSGAAAGRTLDLTKNLTTVGKPGLQVAVITRRPNGYFITHVEGATYPTLNGTSLGPQAHQLNDHDLIEIAGVKMEFFYKP